MSSVLTSAQRPKPNSPRYIGRFAPSPTGPLHFGSLLAAVGSYLQARVAGGWWLIRIEDLDRPRVVPGATDLIIGTLAAFGFEWDDAIQHQSLRLDRYAEALDRLRAQQLVYSCSCSRSQIAAFNAAHLGLATDLDNDELRYPGTCRHRAQTDAAATRFRVPDGTVQFLDAIHGLQQQDVAATVGDSIVQRRDGVFAYHLAVVVDDAAQNITEVVRGADLLASTARQIQLQQALNLPTPAYCHVPVAVDGAGDKLSKASQSQAIDPAYANALLWQALDALRQTPPNELRAAPVREVWDWAYVNWTLVPLANQSTCLAPAPHSPTSNNSDNCKGLPNLK